MSTAKKKEKMSTTLKDHELEEIYKFAVQLGKDAGGILMKGALLRWNQGHQLDAREKESSVDIATQTDEGWRRISR